MSQYEHLSKEELVRLLTAREKRDKTTFGLVWEASEIERDKAINADFVALDLNTELSTKNKPWENLIIEGDNFDALRYLRMCYAGKVKCVYIDPPYNTGNRDFVYNDRFVDTNDTWRHSTWVEFMYQRLSLAKDLLRQDGVIFVSIDDNEIYALGLLMNKIFGTEKHLGTLIWKTRTNPDSRNKTGLSTDHEYILCFGAKIRGTPVDKEKFSNPDNDLRGPWRSADMTGLATKDKRPNLHYDLVNPETGISYDCPHKGWRFNKRTMTRLIQESRVLWPSSSSGRPRLKKFYLELENKEMGFSSILAAPLTSEGADDLKKLGLRGDFSFPKPVDLISQLTEQATSDGDLVLDFFAGSGTTAHAVLKLNAEDGGNRRFILVSNTEATPADPGKNLCRDVCAQRVRRVIEGYGDTAALEGNFAYLRCRRIPPDGLFEIDHAQMWTALQLLHFGTLLPFDATARFLVAENDGSVLAYLPRMENGAIRALNKVLKEVGAVTLYSWQPKTLRQSVHGSHIHHEAIPESLARRFGLKNQT